MQIDRWVRALWIVAAVFCLLAFALYWPVMRAPRAVTIAECGDCAELLRSVPPTAEEIYVVPSGGAFFFELRRHPIREGSLVEGFPATPLVALAIGDAPVVAWRAGDSTSFAVRLGTARRLLLGLLPIRQALEIRDGVVFFGPRGHPGLGPPPELVLADGAAHAFAIHRRHSPVPGLHAPSLTAITLGDASLSVVSRAPARTPRPETGSLALPHPAGAMLSFESSSLPDSMSRFERVLPFDISGLGGRGMLALYSAESGTLAPKLRGVIVAPASPGETASSLIGRLLPSIEGASTSERVVAGVSVARREALGLTADAAVRDGEAILAFDGASMETYLAEQGGAAPDRQALWSLRMKPPVVFAMLQGIRDSLGFRLLGSGARDSIRRLHQALGLVRDAKSLTMELLPRGELDEVKVDVVW